MKTETLFRVIGVAIPIVGAMVPLLVKSLLAKERLHPVLINVLGPRVMAKRGGRAGLHWPSPKTIGMVVLLVVAFGAGTWLHWLMTPMNVGNPHHIAASLPALSLTAVGTFLFKTTFGLHVFLLILLLAMLFLVRHAVMNGFLQLDLAARILSVFLCLVVLFGLSAVITYRNFISVSPDQIYEGIALFIAMAAGMFVQVIAGNYAASQKLLTMSASQLVFPLLYSPFVYFPLWGLTSSSPRLSFSLYAAFVNGYFWESVVSAVKSQAKDKTNRGQLPVPVDPDNSTPH